MMRILLGVWPFASPDFLFIALIKTTKSSFRWRWFIWLMYPDHRPTMSNSKAKIKQGRNLELATIAEPWIKTT